MSGERRLRAAKLLDWTSIDAKVIQTVSEGESAAKGLIENLQREDLNPIEEAEGFKELQGLNDDHWTQEQIAKVTGKGRTYITDSLRLLNLPEDVQEDVRRQTLSRSHAIELLRLNNAKEQKRLAAKVGKRGLTVMQTRAIIDRRQGKLPSPQSPLPSGHGSRTRDEGPADPLSDLWPALHERQGFAPGVDWEARYGAHKPAPGIPLTGWYFFAGSFQGLTKAELSSWFRQMAQALETGQEGPALSEAEQQAFADKVEAQELGGHFKPLDPAEIEKNRVLNERASELWLPRSEEEAKEMEKSSRNIRLPKTARDWAEAEDAATKGPASIYSWLCGPDSYWARKAAPLTWKDLGETDPIIACHQVIEGMLKFRESNE